MMPPTQRHHDATNATLPGPSDAPSLVWSDIGVGCNMSLLQHGALRWWRLRCAMVNGEGNPLPQDPQWAGLGCAVGYQGPQLVAAVAKVRGV